MLRQSQSQGKEAGVSPGGIQAPGLRVKRYRDTERRIRGESSESTGTTESTSPTERKRGIPAEELLVTFNLESAPQEWGYSFLIYPGFMLRNVRHAGAGVFLRSPACSMT